MNCPNCGREVRSKTRCAFCGHEFDGEDYVKETQAPAGFSQEEPKVVSDYEVEDDFYEEEIVPKTKRRGGFGRILWALIKLALAVFILFLLIAFGPKYASKLWNQFGFGNNGSIPVEQVTTVSETTQSGVTQSGTTQNGSTESGTTEVASESETTTLAPESVANATVNMDNYPLTVLNIELPDQAVELSREDLEVGISANGTETLIENYSLLKEGKELKISFNNPAVEVIAASQPEQTVFVRSAKANLDVSSPVTIPTSAVDTEKVTQINQFVTDNLSQLGDVSAAVQKVDENTPILYTNQSVEASQLFSWFVLGRTFAAVQSGDLALDTNVQILDALKASGDEGTLAYEEEGIEYTVEELVNLVIAQDVTAMNHLIQATGGPNAFNLWLSEHNYFDTKVNELLGTDAQGHVTGTTTSVQDVTNLLVALAKDELNTPELDTQLKELLLQTPMTEKYPEGLEIVKRRFEIASNDADGKSQAYSAILEAEDAMYVVVLNVMNPSDTDEVVSAIRSTVRQITNYLATGEVVADEEDNTQTNEETSQEQVSVVENTEVAATTVEGGFVSPGGYVYGADTDGDGYPNTVYDNATGVYREITWSPGNDGLYYFDYVR